MRPMIQKITIFSIIAIFSLIAGCSAPEYVRPETYVIEKERVVNKSFDAIWQSAVEWFATHNTPIKNIDKTSGLISTDYSLSIQEALQYMDCGAGESNFNGKIELTGHSGNFNVLIKKINNDSTKVNVNVFFGCLANKYRYESLLSTDYVFESSSRVSCSSKGRLEREILDYLSAK